MRRSLHILAAIVVATPAAAQAPRQDTWYLGGGIDAVRFGHVVVSDAASGVAAELRPSGRLAAHLSLARSVGLWELRIEADWADGQVEAANDVVSIRDLTADVSRYRLALGIRRSVAGLGAGALALELVPTLDVWSVTGASRLRVGGEGRLVVLVPVGPVELEHRIGFGFSASPIETEDVGIVAEERGLRTLLIGVGLRTGL